MLFSMQKKKSEKDRRNKIAVSVASFWHTSSLLGVLASPLLLIIGALSFFSLFFVLF